MFRQYSQSILRSPHSLFFELHTVDYAQRVFEQSLPSKTNFPQWSLLSESMDASGSDGVVGSGDALATPIRPDDVSTLHAGLPTTPTFDTVFKPALKRQSFLPCKKKGKRIPRQIPSTTWFLQKTFATMRQLGRKCACNKEHSCMAGLARDRDFEERRHVEASVACDTAEAKACSSSAEFDGVQTTGRWRREHRASFKGDWHLLYG